MATAAAASKLLGIHRNTLQRKMIEYKLGEQRPRKKPVRDAQQGARGAAAKGRLTAALPRLRSD